jgi:hypothetical protein
MSRRGWTGAEGARARDVEQMIESDVEKARVRQGIVGVLMQRVSDWLSASLRHS